jgi:CBS domain-containing protein
MSVRTHSRASVCRIGKDETVRFAAERMAKEGMGMLVVVDGDRPVGILTDRDVAMCRAGEARVADAMSGPVVSIHADASLAHAVATLGRRGVRRMPVLDSEGHLEGLISADDVLRLLASELYGLAAVAAAQMPQEPEPEGQAAAARCELEPAHYLSEVVRVRANDSVDSALDAMREHAVGCVAVTSETDEPVGVLTDRDVALRVIARGADCTTTPVSAAMSSPVVACNAAAPLDAVVEQMRSHGVRRVLVTRDGRLAGIVTFDDLVAALGGELQRLGEAARRQLRREQRRVQVEHAREEIAEKLHEAASRLRQLGNDAMSAVGREVESLREKVSRWRE